MIDALTGETSLEEPVVSKTGHVYEKRVIEKYLRDNNNKCPITDQDLSPSDLIPIKVNKVVKPRPPAATSIPGMLQLFQNEWDALMLESYTLKQQLDSVRQELAHALYQHDAACRVIARLIKERDEARNTLTEFQSQTASTSSKPTAMEVESALDEGVLNDLKNKAAELSAGRKKRTISESLASSDDLKSYKITASFPLHSTKPAGITTVDIHPNQELIATGGNDHHITVFNKSSKKVATTIKGHSKAITQVKFHPTEQVLLSSSVDKTARVWNTTSGEATHVIKHEGEVSGVALHPTGNYFVTSSHDQTWAMHNISRGETLAQTKTDVGLHSVEIHPDGLLLGIGGKSVVQFWDLKTQQKVAALEGHKGNVFDITFSENGYYVASAAEDNIIKLWDLRKLKVLNSFELSNFGLSSIQFDFSGSYLAASGEKAIRLFSMGKTQSEIGTLSGHSGLITDVKFGKDAQWLASVSADRNLSIWTK